MCIRDRYSCGHGRGSLLEILVVIEKNLRPLSFTPGKRRDPRRGRQSLLPRHSARALTSRPSKDEDQHREYSWDAVRVAQAIRSASDTVCACGNRSVVAVLGSIYVELWSIPSTPALAADRRVDLGLGRAAHRLALWLRLWGRRSA